MNSSQNDSLLTNSLVDVDETVKAPLATFSAVVSNVFLFFLIFGLSATVNLKDLKHQLHNLFAIGTGVAMQFMFMPLLGFASICIFYKYGFTDPMCVSLLVLTASPGGSYSNWWCSLFNAELALSVAMTSVSSLLSIGLLPANLLLYGWLAFGVVLGDENVNLVASLDFGAIFISLGVVMGAILSGLYVGYKYDNPKFHARANHFGSICGILLILFSLFLGSGAGGAETNFWSLPWSFYVGTAFPCVVGMTVANIVSRSFHLTPSEVMALSIECCYQNTAIATSVAVTMFLDPTERAEAVSVPLFYGVVEAVIIGVYCVCAWKLGWTKAPSNEKICVVLTKTYEIHGRDNINVDEADEEEHGDDDEEHQHLEHHRLNCWKRMFIPRYPDCIGVDASLSRKTEDKKTVFDDDDAARNRVYSEDVTVSTNYSTPPATPDPFSDSLSNDGQASTSTRDRIHSDMDLPSIKGNIRAIHEEVDESDSSQDDNNSMKLVKPSEGSVFFIPRPPAAAISIMSGAMDKMGEVDINESSSTNQEEDEDIIDC